MLRTRPRPPLRECASAAATKPRKIGCGTSGVLLNSGWYCTPMKNGCPESSTISTRSRSGFDAR